MLKQVDFIHNISDQHRHLLDYRPILIQVGQILGDGDKKLSINDRSRFALLQRMLWAISILNNIDKYDKFTEVEPETFFLAFNSFIDAANSFQKNKQYCNQNFFIETLKQKIFNEDIINPEKRNRFIRFIRSLSVAHTVDTNSGGGFLREGYNFILLSIDKLPVSTDSKEDIIDVKAFFFHAFYISDNCSEFIIFKIYIDEIKQYLKSHFENIDFSKLELRKKYQK